MDLGRVVDLGRHLALNVSVMCARAPTEAPSGVKLKFYKDLQDTIEGIALSDILVMLDDLNAVVEMWMLMVMISMLWWECSMGMGMT